MKSKARIAMGKGVCLGNLQGGRVKYPCKLGAVLNFLTTVIIAATVIVVSASTLVLAETYRWTDKNGNVGYADSLQKVPPQYRDSARRVDGKSSAGSDSKTFQTVPSDPTGIVSSPTGDSEETYAVWRDRMNSARADLELLKTQREVARKEYDTLRGERFGKLFADPEVDARHRAKLTELDEQLSKKEYELTTTIPDEARKAGVPPGVLSQ
jgi:Domain of unknown function (DUF4124)